MHPFSLLIKPAGGGCNLDCRYCFYRPDHPQGQMAPDVLARALDAYAALPFGGKSVSIQGGEPLLAFETGIFQLVDAHPFEKSVQTNATLITPEIAAFLARGGWLAGASLDGPPHLNRLRGDSYDAAVRGIRLLEDAGADYNLVTVVSAANVAAPAEVYTFLRDNFSTRFHQYIECTGPRDEITGEQWGNFLIGLFDAWIENDSRTVSVRLFDSIVSQLVCGYPTQCSYSDNCRHHLVIEADGSVYPCDFHVQPDLKLGNVQTHSFAEMLDSEVYRNFADAKLDNLPDECGECEFYEFCRGDCPRSAQRLCAGWKRFFAHALPRFRELTANL